jgi:GNAT superfamily N-acetyltransferase
MRLRRGELSDAEPMARLLRACFDEMTYLPRLHTPEEDLHFMRGVVLPNQEVWIAEDAGEFVGFASLADDELTHLYVAPHARNRGIGAGLFRQATKRRPEGFMLWTFQANEAARRFYGRHGCRLVQLTDGEHNEERVPDVQYEWRPNTV